MQAQAPRPTQPCRSSAGLLCPGHKTRLAAPCPLSSPGPRPALLRSATSAGIGLFLAFIGVQSSEGLGVATYNSATLVTLGGCAPEYRTSQYTIPGSAISGVGSPDSICYVDPATGNLTANGGLFVPSGQRWARLGGVRGSAGVCLTHAAPTAPAPALRWPPGFGGCEAGARLAGPAGMPSHL